METRSRSIENWLNDVRRGAIRLPRFQRGEVWTPSHVKNFLWAILKDRPLGVFLVLEVNADDQPFETRPLEGGPDNSERLCRQHLLDGQQRLTALWRSFADNYEKHTFYVTFERTDDLKEYEVLAVSKRGRDKGKIDKPDQEFSEGWVPLNILAPGEEISRRAMRWRKQATDDEESREALEILIDRLRSKFSKAVLPFLSLPQETPPDEAIEIFVETNRSSVRLSHYELAVAQMESETQESLDDKISDLISNVPAIESLDSPVGDLVLKVQCLLEGKRPTYGYYVQLDFRKLNEDWENIVQGIAWTTEVLEDLRIWNEQRLPTAVPLRVLPALHRHIPQSGAAHATAMRLVKKYLWWSFLTDRYERQANDRLKEDHDALAEVLTKSKDETNIPAFKSDKPTEDEIRDSGWPKTRGRLNRAILAACSLGGAKDIASDKGLKRDSKADYHHIFPKAVLREAGKDPDRALNCMLLDPPTNREWAKKWPGDFLLETIKGSERDVKKRLETHLLPADDLIALREGSGADLGRAYESFLAKRAEMVQERIEHLLTRGELD